jgi:tetratricopeptide (TPR) repeat protein
MNEITIKLEQAYKTATIEGDYNYGLKICSEVVNDNPTLPEPLRKRAAIYAYAEQFDSAIEDITRAILLDSNNPELYFFRGWWNLCVGNFESSVVDQTTAIETAARLNCHDFDESAYMFRAAALLRLKKYTEAVADCENVREDFVIYISNLGLLSRQKIHAEALAKRG